MEMSRAGGFGGSPVLVPSGEPARDNLPKGVDGEVVRGGSKGIER